MRSRSQRAGAVVAVVATAAVFAATANAAAVVKPATVRGVVVAREHARGTLVVAGAKGIVSTLRTGAAIRVGSRVRARVLRLADGTFKASAVRASGKASRARLHATVVSVTGTRLVLSAGGSVFALDRGRSTAAVGAARGSLKAGDVVNTTVDINSQNQSVTQSNLQVVGTTTYVTLEGKISSLASDSLVVAVDNGALTTIGIPASLSLPSTVAVGDSVEVETQYAGGVFTLVTIQDDHAAATGSSEGEHSNVEAEGTVSDLSNGTLSVAPESGSPVTFTVPSGFALGTVAVGDKVHAKGQVQSDGSVALVRLQAQQGSSGEGQTGSASGDSSSASGDTGSASGDSASASGDSSSASGDSASASGETGSTSGDSGGSESSSSSTGTTTTTTTTGATTTTGSTSTGSTSSSGSSSSNGGSSGSDD